jgi:hypothetical protein
MYLQHGKKWIVAVFVCVLPGQSTICFSGQQSALSPEKIWEIEPQRTRRDNSKTFVFLCG